MKHFLCVSLFLLTPLCVSAALLDFELTFGTDSNPKTEIVYNGATIDAIITYQFLLDDQSPDLLIANATTGVWLITPNIINVSVVQVTQVGNNPPTLTTLVNDVLATPNPIYLWISGNAIGLVDNINPFAPASNTATFSWSMSGGGSFPEILADDNLLSTVNLQENPPGTFKYDQEKNAASNFTGTVNLGQLPYTNTFTASKAGKNNLTIFYAPTAIPEPSHFLSVVAFGFAIFLTARRRRNLTLA